jgi:hypothetical protein
MLELSGQSTSTHVWQTEPQFGSLLLLQLMLEHGTTLMTPSSNPTFFLLTFHMLLVCGAVHRICG